MDPTHHLARLAEIDDASFRMAKKVAKAPLLREAHAKEASDLKRELLDRAEALEEWAPDAYRDHARVISESLLDLVFVEHEGNAWSLRLASVLRDSRANRR